MRVRPPFARSPRPGFSAGIGLCLALGALTSLSLPPLAAAQDVEAPAAETPTAPAAEKKPPFRKGVHRLRLGLGYSQGDAARTAGILSAPLTGEPGQPNFPAAVPLLVELDGGGTANFGYTYFFDEKWGLDLGISRFAGQLVDTEFDIATVDAQLATTTLSADDKEHLRTRMIAHAASHDLTVTTIDVSAARIFAPRSKWPFEVSAGLGWAISSLGSTTIGDRVVYERLVTSRVINPQDSAVVANDIPVPSLPYVEVGCLADNDPCLEMTEQSGLAWNIAATAHHAFTDRFLLDLGVRVRVISQVVDPGDQLIAPEVGVGISFLFGGD